MEEQHAVPQDITGFQFKLVGDMTLKQFGELAFGVIMAYLFYASSWHPILKWPLTLFFGFFGVALLILFFVWRYSQQNPTQDPPRSNPAPTQAHESSGKPASSLPIDGVQVRAREREPVSSPAAKPATAPETPKLSASASGPALPSASASATSQTNTVPAPIGASTSSNGVAVAVSSLPAAPAAPPPPRLQGVVYNPRRPSAVISGKVLFIGDRFGASRVAAISPNSVTLIGGGQTNVLTMEE